MFEENLLLRPETEAEANKSLAGLQAEGPEVGRLGQNGALKLAEKFGGEEGQALAQLGGRPVPVYGNVGLGLQAAF